MPLIQQWKFRTDVYGWEKKEKPDSSAKNLGESFSCAILLEEYLLSIYLMCTKPLRYLGKKWYLFRT